MKALFSLLVALLTTAISLHAQTITSTSTGGSWTAASTWVGGQVPDMGNDVVIAGRVTTSGELYCRNITVLNVGTLVVNRLEISGDFLNQGTVQATGSGRLRLHGALRHEGSTFDVTTILLANRATQTIVCSAGRSIDSRVEIDSLGTLRLGSDARVTGSIYMRGGTIELAGYELDYYYIDHDGYSDDATQPATIVGPGTLRGTGSATGAGWIGQNAIPDELYLRGGSIDLRGFVRLNARAEGMRVVVHDTLWIDELNVRGEFVSHGTVSTTAAGTLRIAGTLSDHGKLLRPRVRVWQSDTLTLWAAPGIAWSTTEFYADSGTVRLGSDVEIEDLVLEHPSSRLELAGHSLRFYSIGSSDNYGTIVGPGILHARPSGAALLGRSFPGLQLTGDTIGIHGRVLRAAFASSAPIVIGDTLGVEAVITNGALISNGMLGLPSNGGSVLRIGGDFIHRGGPITTSLALVGSRSRTIEMPRTASMPWPTTTGRRVTLDDYSTLPGLYIDDTARVLISEGATLEVSPGSIQSSPDRIENEGTVVVTASGAGQKKFWMFETRLAETDDTMQVSTIGRAPESLSESIDLWWRVDARGIVTLPSLTLSYLSSDVTATIDESKLTIFHSPDDGRSWDRLDGLSIARDPSANSVTASGMLPAFGAYTLAPSDASTSVVPDTIRFDPLAYGREDLRISRIWNSTGSALRVDTAFIESGSSAIVLDGFDCMGAEIPINGKCYFALAYRPIYPDTLNVYDTAVLRIETTDPATPVYRVVVVASWTPVALARVVVSKFPERISIRPPARTNSADYMEIAGFNMGPKPRLQMLAVDLPEHVYIQRGDEVSGGHVELMVLLPADSAFTHRIPLRVSVPPDQVTMMAEREKDGSRLLALTLGADLTTIASSTGMGSPAGYARGAALNALGEIACGGMVEVLQEISDDLDVDIADLKRIYVEEAAEAIQSAIPNLDPTSDDNVVSKYFTQLGEGTSKQMLKDQLYKTAYRASYDKMRRDQGWALKLDPALKQARANAQSVADKAGPWLDVALGCWGEIIETAVDEIMLVYEVEKENEYQRVENHLDKMQAIRQSGKALELLEELVDRGKIGSEEYKQYFDELINLTNPDRAKHLMLDLMKRVDEATEEHQSQVRGPWDPNDKLGASGFPCLSVKHDESGISSCANIVMPYSGQDSLFTYRIVFENKKEATAEAERIVVVDTLSALFDPESVEAIYTSHPDRLSVERSGRVVRFVFDEIYLPPNIRVPEGEGFVEFRVRPLSTPMPVGTVIENFADIYFDYMKPVRTATVSYIIGPDIPTPIAPANDAMNVPRNPLLRWSQVPVGNRYETHLTTDRSFATIDRTSIVDDPHQIIEHAAPLQGKSRYWWRVRSLHDTIHSPWSIIHEFETSDLLLSIPGTPSDEEASMTISSIVPTPTTGRAHVTFTLSHRGTIWMDLYDVDGQVVSRPIDGRVFEMGRFTIDIDASSLPSGTYLCRIRSDHGGEARGYVIVAQ